MIRYTLFVIAVLGTAATAIASANPDAPPATSLPRTNVTIIEKNDVFPILGPIVVEECAVEDCSDVQS